MSTLKICKLKLLATDELGAFAGKHDEIEKKTEKLQELLKYLAHILKQELDVNDLKEKVVIHSKSINEHFTEPLLKELQSVKNLNDYRQLETSLVYALLRNFCGGIKPSSKGWDYEPPDDETHVGADIERIRFMWNKYCDDNFEFKHLEEVYNRMKQKYGTEAVHGDYDIRKCPHKDQENTEVELGGDGNKKPQQKDEEISNGLECMRIKIPSIKLNEDCTVEKGIVITENITTALKILKTRNVVILKGSIGCGKTHALNAILNHFQRKNWETAWMEAENMIKKKICKEKSTLLLCDNLFGRYGSSVFSQGAVNKIEDVLKEIESSEENIKVVIGMHMHVYDEVRKNLNLNFLCQKNITVEMDNLSDAETLLIFKEQLETGHCKMVHSNCWFQTVGFQSVLQKLSNNQGHIGGPFLSLMYCNQHELFSDEAFSVNPFQTLLQNFKRMRQDTSTLYHCLVYLMCVQEYNFEEELKPWAGNISAEISKQELEKIATTSGYIQVDANRATLIHEILTMVLLKVAAEQRETLFPVVHYCREEVMLQLFRPADSKQRDFYCEFIDVDKNSSYKDTGKKCIHRIASRYKETDMDHPLMTDKFVKEKYPKYLYNDPKYHS